MVDEERFEAVVRNAALITLFVALVMRIPFVIGIDVSAKSLPLITGTGGIAVFYSVCAWLDGATPGAGFPLECPQGRERVVS